MNFQRNILQGVSFKTRPINPPRVSLNGPLCLTLLQGLVTSDSGWGPLRTPSLRGGGLSSSWASHAPLLLVSRFPSRRWESISGQSSLGSQSSKLISTPQTEWAPLGARMFSAGYSGVLQKTASERPVATCSGPLAHPHPPRMPEAHW